MNGSTSGPRATRGDAGWPTRDPVGPPADLDRASSSGFRPPASRDLPPAPRGRDYEDDRRPSRTEPPYRERDVEQSFRDFPPSRRDARGPVRDPRDEGWSRRPPPQDDYYSDERVSSIYPYEHFRVLMVVSIDCRPQGVGSRRPLLDERCHLRPLVAKLLYRIGDREVLCLLDLSEIFPNHLIEHRLESSLKIVFRDRVEGVLLRRQSEEEEVLHLSHFVVNEALHPRRCESGQSEQLRLQQLKIR